jgi:crotonobetainyl-CoA:carnitine CoA-transferase CaiB-like acyl-CoA transferase
VSERSGGPLESIRVIDLSRAMAGPYATLMLADAGADVIKIERPGKGDDTRAWGPPFVGDGDDRESVYYLSVNRNKRSVALDLKLEDDLAFLRELIATADVVVENFRPGVMDRLGLGEDALLTAHPRLVGLSITGFGSTGPDGTRPGFDQILQGEAGLMSLTGPVGGPPTKVGVPIADILAGMFGAFGVLAALQERERTGEGQWVRTSLLGGMIAIHTFQGTRWLLAGEVPEPDGNRHPLIAPYGAFAVADGQINIAVGSQSLWRAFAPLVGLDPENERFATNGDRLERIDDLEAAMAPALEKHGTDDWLAKLAAAGIPAGKVRSLDEVYDLPQVHDQQLIQQVMHPSLGALRLPGSPVQFGSGQRQISPPPRLGEHTEQLRTEFAVPKPDASA